MFFNDALIYQSAIVILSYNNSLSVLHFFFFRPELVVKKLRYYARFIVVCLLLNKMDVVKDLVKVNCMYEEEVHFARVQYSW